MNRSLRIYRLTAAALLCAVGIVIPMFSPIKLVIPPASFTLASHVAVFLSMFISPTVAVSVALGTTLGFFLGGFPIVIVLRALSHVLFALGGALWLKYRPDTLAYPLRAFGFNLATALVHAVCEMLTVLPFYFGNLLDAKAYDSGFLYSVILLVGVGTVIHSSVDYYISLFLWRALSKNREISKISAVTFERA